MSTYDKPFPRVSDRGRFQRVFLPSYVLYILDTLLGTGSVEYAGPDSRCKNAHRLEKINIRGSEIKFLCFPLGN